MLAVSAAHRIPTCEAILDGPAGPALAEFAHQRHVDLVIASTHGRGMLGRFVRGSVAFHLMHALRANILLIKPQHAAAQAPSQGFARVLVATDGSAEAAVALDPVLGLAAATATVTIFHAVRPAAEGGLALEKRRIHAEGQLAALVPRLTARGIGADTAISIAANPAGAILAQAERRGADLIALTTRERSEAERLLFGSVADTIVRHTTVPVLICHAGV
jgi:nucleotide-binding universal stress UspA family protein